MKNLLKTKKRQTFRLTAGRCAPDEYSGKKLSGAVKEVKIAGMDGYSEAATVYYDNELNYDFSKEALKRNKLISDELREIGRTISLKSVTPTAYDL